MGLPVGHDLYKPALSYRNQINWRESMAEPTVTVEEITETVDESFSVFKTTISSSYGGVPFVTKVSFEF